MTYILELTHIQSIRSVIFIIIYGESNDTNTGLWAKAKSHIYLSIILTLYIDAI